MYNSLIQSDNQLGHDSFMHKILISQHGCPSLGSKNPPPFFFSSTTFLPNCLFILKRFCLFVFFYMHLSGILMEWQYWDHWSEVFKLNCESVHVFVANISSNHFTWKKTLKWLPFALQIVNTYVSRLRFQSLLSALRRLPQNQPYYSPAPAYSLSRRGSSLSHTSLCPLGQN